MLLALLSTLSIELFTLSALLINYRALTKTRLKKPVAVDVASAAL
jgi:hypothetical protein